MCKRSVFIINKKKFYIKNAFTKNIQYNKFVIFWKIRRLR